MLDYKVNKNIRNYVNQGQDKNFKFLPDQKLELLHSISQLELMVLRFYGNNFRFV